MAAAIQLSNNMSSHVQMRSAITDASIYTRYVDSVTIHAHSRERIVLTGNGEDKKPTAIESSLNIQCDTIEEDDDDG